MYTVIKVKILRAISFVVRKNRMLNAVEVLRFVIHLYACYIMELEIDFYLHGYIKGTTHHFNYPKGNRAKHLKAYLVVPKNLSGLFSLTCCP